MHKVIMLASIFLPLLLLFQAPGYAEADGNTETNRNAGRSKRRAAGCDKAYRDDRR